MRQLIEIGLTTSSASESFRILKVYLEPKDPNNPVLVVVSKRSDPAGCLGVATTGRHDVSIEVEQLEDRILPVKHYVLGLDRNCKGSSATSATSEVSEKVSGKVSQEASMNSGQKTSERPETPEVISSNSPYDFLPNVPFRLLKSQKDLVLSDSAQLLYENPKTEEKEEAAKETFLKQEMKLLEEFYKKQEKDRKSNDNNNKSSLIRSDSPRLADASACVGSSQHYDWEQPELPLYVKVLATLTVGAFGVFLFRLF